MTNEIIIERQRAADAARDYLSGKLSWDQFMELFANSEDDLVGDLVTLIEHEPKRGGLLGLNERDWSEYQSQVSSAIVALKMAPLKRIVTRLSDYDKRNIGACCTCSVVS